jgi:hypothetical protein
MASRNHRFADKHPPGTIVPEKVHQAVRDHMFDQGISCGSAHQICVRLNASPQEAGIAIDLQEGRIRRCQLGLFGHSAPIEPAQSVTPELKGAIEEALVDGRLSCANAWRIADAAGLPRLAVGQACERLKIKINQCQLGAF